MSKSSTNVEYNAMANAMVEIMWIQTLLKELHVSSPPSARLWCDNMSAIYLSWNLVFHGRTNHIKVDYHFVCDKVMCKLLEVHFISTHDQIANGFTMPLPQHKLLEFRRNLNIDTL
jgi:hypothetical protein